MIGLHPLQSQARGGRRTSLAIDRFRRKVLPVQGITLRSYCDMQTRYKIFILLFTVTLALGALTLLHSSNDNDAVLRFRSLFSNRTLYTLSHTLASITDGTSLWYGGISLFAIIMIVLVFRAARRDGSQGLRERLIELKPTKVPAAKLRPSETVSAKAEVRERCCGRSLRESRTYCRQKTPPSQSWRTVWLENSSFCRSEAKN